MTYRTRLLCTVFAFCALAPMAAARAQEAAYDPPPLFGSGPVPLTPSDIGDVPSPPPEEYPEVRPQVQKEAAKPAAPVWVAPQAPRRRPVPQMTATLAGPDALDNDGDNAINEAASAAERVQNPVSNSAPLNTDTLLAYPPARIAANAQHLITPRRGTAKSGIPDLLGYDDVKSPGTTTATPAATPRRARPAAAVSPTPKVTYIHEAPKVSVFDEQTGKIEPAPKFLPAPTTKTSRSAAPRPMMPATPPVPVSRSEIASIPSADAATRDLMREAPLPQITKDDLNRDLLNADDTSARGNTAAPLPSVQRAIAAVNGNAHEDGEEEIMPDLRMRPVTLPFSGQSTDLDTRQREQIDSLVIPYLSRNPTTRISVYAYASGSGNNKSTDDRRIALARGLAIRQYLQNNGVDGRLIGVRALGKATSGGLPDRADIIFQ